MLPDLVQGTEEEVPTSPIFTRSSHIHSGQFKWANGIVHSPTSENAHPEFAGPGLLTICDIAALEPRKTNHPLSLPTLPQPKRPRHPIRIPCIFKPFTSFEATELAVQHLRARLRRVG
jgi:hypothetical protein